MIEKILAELKDCEQAAEQLIVRAKGQAKELAKQARVQAEQMIKEAVGQAQEEAQQILTASRQKSEDWRRQESAKRQARLAGLKEQAAGNLERAGAYIVEAARKKYGLSAD